MNHLASLGFVSLLNRSQLRLAALFVTAFLGTLGWQQPASAAILYATNYLNGKLDIVDTTANTVTLLTTVPTNPDSLIFDNSGRIVYTALSTGGLRIYDPVAHTDTLIASGFLQPRDLTLEPGGASVLVGDFNGGAIYRVNLTTLVKTGLAAGATWDGITYDSSGRLFAVRNGNTVVQLNPATGAIINSTPILGATLDGLTFDSFTGHLWAGSSVGLIEISTNLTSIVTHAGGTSFDGVEGDGNGLIYAVEGFTRVWQYNIGTGTYTALTADSGIDDLAPVVGLGSATPEPATLALAGFGIAGLFGYAWRRKKAATAA